MSLVRASVSAQDRDSVRRASVGAGKTAVVVGGEGRMGRWFVRFLADQGYSTGTLDVRASDEENAWARQALPTADLVISAAPPVATAALYDEWVAQPPTGVIADIASIKTPLVGSIRRLQQAGAQRCVDAPDVRPVRRAAPRLRRRDLRHRRLHAQREVERLFSRPPRDWSTCRSTSTIG